MSQCTPSTTIIREDYMCEKQFCKGIMFLLFSAFSAFIGISFKMKKKRKRQNIHNVPEKLVEKKEAKS
jgi:hypothetical protein